LELKSLRFTWTGYSQTTTLNKYAMLHLGYYKNLKESSMSPKIIRRKEVEQRIGLACSTIYAMMAAQKFPRPVRIGRRAVGWLEEDIQNWLSDKINRPSGK
jgi:prophage regulatory protein